MAGYRTNLRAVALLAPPTLLIGWAAFSQTPSAETLPAGPGRDVFVQACSTCHAPEVATRKRRTSDEWTAVIQQMIAMGAQVGDEEAGVIHDYLAANFNAQNVAVAAPKPAPAK